MVIRVQYKSCQILYLQNNLDKLITHNAYTNFLNWDFYRYLIYVADDVMAENKHTTHKSMRKHYTISDSTYPLYSLYLKHACIFISLVLVGCSFFGFQSILLTLIYESLRLVPAIGQVFCMTSFEKVAITRGSQGLYLGMQNQNKQKTKRTDHSITICQYSKQQLIPVVFCLVIPEG